MSTCQYSLLENAFDFLLSASEHAQSGAQRDYKYVILHLFAGIELLLKERLRHAHWSLLFQNPVDEADQSRFQQGAFRGVDFDTLIGRLARCASSTIADADQTHMRSLRRLRNRVQHFDVDIDISVVTAQLATGLSFALDFYDSNIRVLNQIDETIITAIHDNLSGHRDFITQRINQIQAEVNSAFSVTECPRCFQLAMMLGDDPPHCAFCHYRPDAETLALEIIEDQYYVNTCPECERETAVLMDHGEWLCMSCGVQAEYCNCDNCGGLMPSSSELAVCDDCYRHSVERE